MEKEWENKSLKTWLLSFKRHLHSGRYPLSLLSTSFHWSFISIYQSIQMLHTHLHLNNVQFLSSHSSPSLFPLPSSKFSTVPFPTPIRRRTSFSTLRFRSFTRRLRNSSTNDVKLNETEQKKPVNRAYPFHEIEPKWQRFWDEFRTFRTPDDDDIDTSKPKYYILDMFPYPRFSIEVTLIFQFLDLH